MAINKDWLNKETGKYSCPYCEKEYTKKGISTHIWKMHEDGINHNPNKGYEDGTRKAWNKGLSKESSESVKRQSESVTKTFRIQGGNTLGRKHSEETKIKISEARIKYLEENPDKIPYILNHYSKGESYPETYFREVLTNNKIEFLQEKQVGRYSLDFVIGNINLEIDGDQHYLDEKIIESDKRRTKYLEDLGYSTVRIKWSDYKKLKPVKQEEFITSLINKLK